MPAKLKLEHPVVVGLCLALAVAAVYWPVAGFEFTNYDDTFYVTGNPQVLKGLTWEDARWAFTHGYSGNWHPLTWMSHMLDCQLYGLNPAGHHLTSVWLHAANSVLVFLLLRRLTGAAWRSALVAALFALHPLHVESVAWVAERKDVLSGLFFLLTLWAYVRYVQSAECRGRSAESGSAQPATRSPDHASRFYLLALVFFALGLMSKPMLVTVPFVLLLLDYWPLGRMQNPEGSMQKGEADRAPHTTHHAPRTTHPARCFLLLEKLPFFALAAASCVVTFLVQRAWGAVVPLEHAPFGLRLLNVPVSYVRYLGKLVWPADLAVIYPYVREWSMAVVLGAVLALAGVTLLVLWQCRRRPWLLAGWAAFLGMLVPVIGLVQVGNQSIADRYTYLPSIGFFVLAVWGAAEIAGASRRRRIVGGAIAVALLAACALAARAQVLCWRNTETLFQHALGATSGNVIAYNSLGFYYAAHDQAGKAERAFRSALTIQPACQYSWQGLGATLIEQGKYAEAVAACRSALEADPGMAAAHSTLGLALMKLGRTNDAIAHYAEALRLQPDLADAHYNLANAQASQGQLPAAREHFEASLRSDPGSADAHNNLGYLLSREGQWDRAESEFKSALALRPDLWQAHYGLAAALVRLGRVREAIAHYHATLAAQPELVEVLNRLAWLLATQPDAQVRDGAQAVELAERACRLTHYAQPGVLITLAAACAEAGRFAEAAGSAREAQRLAQAAGQTAFASSSQQLLELFQAGRPYREAGSQKPGQPE